MPRKNLKLRAVLSVEVIISVVLVAIALIVTLGLFSENIKTMIVNGNFQRFFTKGDKTTYSAFNRNYSGDDEYQITGEHTTTKERTDQECSAGGTNCGGRGGDVVGDEIVTEGDGRNPPIVGGDGVYDDPVCTLPDGSEGRRDREDNLCKKIPTAQTRNSFN